jgi:hypothetical protein
MRLILAKLRFLCARFRLILRAMLKVPTPHTASVQLTLA